MCSRLTSGFTVITDLLLFTEAIKHFYCFTCPGAAELGGHSGDNTIGEGQELWKDRTVIYSALMSIAHPSIVPVIPQPLTVSLYLTSVSCVGIVFFIFFPMPWPHFTDSLTNRLDN